MNYSTMIVFVFFTTLLILQRSQALVAPSTVGWVSPRCGTPFTSASRSSRSRLAVASIGSSTSSEEEPMRVSVTKKMVTVNEDGVDWDWQRLASDVFKEDQRPIILFDGVCTLCNGAINFAMDQDETGKLRFCSLQSKVAKSLLLRQGKSPKDFATIVMVTDKTAYYSSDAVSRICMELDAKPLQLFGQLGQITPEFVREAIFQVVSNNRYQFGEYDSCRIDYDGTLVTRFVADPEAKPTVTEESSSSSSL